MKFSDIGHSGDLTQNPVVEAFRGKRAPDIGGSVDTEFLDQGKQTKLGRIPKWFGPVTERNNESAMEMRDGGDVPGVTGQGAGQKAAGVVDEMGDNDLDDLQWKLGGCGQRCGRDHWQIICGEHLRNPGATSVPKSPNELLNRCCGIQLLRREPSHEYQNYLTVRTYWSSLETSRLLRRSVHAWCGCRTTKVDCGRNLWLKYPAPQLV